MKHAIFGAALAGLTLCCGVTQVAASTFGHVTDGVFTGGVGGQEWTGPNVSKTFFPVVGQSGGAYLYVEQGSHQGSPQSVSLGGVSPAVVSLSPGTLFLMYDWVNSVNFMVNPSSFLDVFFEVNAPVAPADYLVRMLEGSNNFLAFERPHGSRAPVNPDGSFDVGAGSGWTRVSTADLDLAQFQTAIGSGVSPDDTVPHLMAEFELSIDNNGRLGRQGGHGFYDPAPAFWSASAKVGNDPPISSGIFSLGPTGSTGVTPVLGPNGGPISQPQAVPEPATWGLVALGLAACLGAARRRKVLRDLLVRRI